MYEYERVRCQKPKGCRDCEYTTFRSSPLEKENFPQKEVVKMSDV